MNTAYIVEYKTMDGNFHKESITAKTCDHAREIFQQRQRGKLRLSRISYIIGVH